MAIYYINENGFILNNIESFRSFVTAFSQFEEVKKILRKGESEKMTVYNKAYVITWVVWGIFFCYILCIWISGICSVRNEYV